MTRQHPTPGQSVIAPPRISARISLAQPSNSRETKTIPTPGKRWRHVIINTHATWLPGDARGFRSRAHRIHSSGDYKSPPTMGEHGGLHVDAVSGSRGEIHLPKPLRAVIGRSMLKNLMDAGHAMLAIAITKVHAHLLVELPDNIVTVKAIVGTAKRISSRAVKRELPGTVWADRGMYKPVKSRAHHRRAFGYILFDQGVGAWTWSFRDKDDVGRYGRARTST